MTIIADISPGGANGAQGEGVSPNLDDMKAPSVLEVTEEQKEGRELVVDAYVGVAEVVFNWSKQLEEIQGNAVRAMTNMTGLTHPDHPLHKEGEDGITVFTATTKDGRQRLVFSLKQIQYIVYYIHTLRLADPSYVEYLAAVEQAGEDGDKPVEPPLDPAENTPVPLPGPWTPAADFTSIVPINLPSQQGIKKMIKDVQKQNKQIEKKLLYMQPEALTPQEKSRAEADEDNNTPGPGLRRAGQREKEQRSQPPPREEGTGWGGFPIGAGQEQGSAPGVEIPWKEEDGVADMAENADARFKVEGSEKEGKDAADDQKIKEGKEIAVAQKIKVEEGATADGSDIEPPAGDDLAAQLNKLNAFVKEMAKSDDSEERALASPSTADSAGDRNTTDTSGEPTADPAEQYHNDAQQAFILAANGGLNAALVARRDAEYAESGIPIPKSADEEHSASIVAPEIGRSLFFALDLTTWEQNENVVLEVGWAATWFQEVLMVDDKDEKVSLEPKEDGEDKEDGALEQITEHGHIIVQDHLLDKRNGTLKPDHRQSFDFGNSIPLTKQDVMPHLKKKLFDAAARAGGGPVYLLLHSVDSDLDELRKLGWRTGGWETELRPEGWEFPSYASEDGIGKVFIIDTARLFGAIENDTSTLPAPNKTRKSLQEVAMIISGGDETQRFRVVQLVYPDELELTVKYCLKVFTAIVSGPSLDLLRIDYQASQMPIAAEQADKLGADNGDDVGGDDHPSVASVTVTKTNAFDLTGAKTKRGDVQAAPTAAATPQLSSTRTTMSSISTSAPESAMPITPPLNAEDESLQSAKAQGGDVMRKGGQVGDGLSDDDEDEDEEFAIKGVWYTNDAGEDILLSEA